MFLFILDVYNVQSADLWMFFGGLGIFIFAMLLVEEALKQLAGRPFKIFLRKHTNNKVKAIFSGAIVTAVLQSSSVVSLMTLAFVGAGVLSMRNALAIVFGANLGTTISSWIIATVGFSVNLQWVSFPLITCASAIYIFTSAEKKLYQFGKFLMGAGFLFLGLALMMQSMADLVNQVDMSLLKNARSVFFVIGGFIFTAIIQSSSAAVAITLGALHTGIIDFNSAVALVIGSELGTTIKIFLGTLTGKADKKRVALGNFLFNVAITVGAYIFMLPIIYFIRNVLAVNDLLIALVVFQSFINLSGILLFFPFIEKFSLFLERRFKGENNHIAEFITKASTEVIDSAIIALGNEAKHLLTHAADVNLKAFQLEPNTGQFTQINNYEDEYNNLKQLEGEMLLFYLELEKQKLEPQETQKAMQYISCARGAIHSAKEIKNIRHNLLELRHSADDELHNYYVFQQKWIAEFYGSFGKCLKTNDVQAQLKYLTDMLHMVEEHYDVMQKSIYKLVKKQGVTEADLSTLMNVNREIYSSGKAILRALKDVALDKESAEIINKLPHYYADELKRN